MAKGRVSDEELEQGVAAAGGLSGFVAAAGVRRDSPFGIDHVQRRPKQLDEEAEGIVVHAVAPISHAKRSATKPPSQAAPPVTSLDQVKQSARLETAHAATRSEKVSLPMPLELRDEVTALARQLQRMRTEKVERITPNTVMRVAIQTFLEQFVPDAVAVSNTESELLEHVRAHLTWT